jgi:sigma-B regulation protein RsbU (phosphoserine phosphatase)
MQTRPELKENPWPYTQTVLKWKLSLLNVGSNMVGAFIVTSYFLYFNRITPFPKVGPTLVVIIVMCIGLVILATIILSRWEADLAHFVKYKRQNQEVPEDLYRRVQRKIINLPAVYSAISLLAWLLASMVMGAYILIEPLSLADVTGMIFNAIRAFVGTLVAGLITSALVYFTADIVCRQILPFFFPQGGLAQTSGVFRLRLQSRSMIVFSLASVLPVVMMAVLSYNKARMMLEMEPASVIQSLLYLTAFLLIVTLAMAILLSRTFSSSIVQPIKTMEQAMSRVAQGDFSATVPVNSNDELGILADHFNRMTEGLAERYRLRRALDLAKEVQQNLLPKKAPNIEGVDIAGTSIYCDETGGDYFDYLLPKAGSEDGIGIVIGDVSGHGVPSALLMATARAFLRQRLALAGSPAKVVNDVNRQLAQDIEDTGRFMTMFYLRLDLAGRQIRWVRAGHDPAMLYDPVSDRFEELKGRGIALGIDDGWRYEDYERTGLVGGQILILASDGVWETRNPEGEMFGKHRIRKIIRNQRRASAEEILSITLNELAEFQQHQKTADDVTLVVLKLTL